MSDAAVARTSAQEVLAVVEHLAALMESRDIVVESGDSEQIRAIDNDIAEYAVKCPDAFGHAIKLCQATRESIKAKRTALTQPYSRQEGMWAGREAHLRHIALQVATAYGNLQGEVFSISEQQGRQYVYVESEDLVPAEYVDVIPEKRVVNAERVEKALKAGVKVPGCRLERRPEYVVVR